MNVFLGDILCPYERRQASNVSLEHALVYWKVQAGSDDGILVVVIYYFRRRRSRCRRRRRRRLGVAVGVHLRLLLLCRRRGLD